MVVVAVVALGVCALAALAWWSSGRTTTRGRIDRPAALADAESAARSERIGLHPGSPGAGM